MAAKIWKPPIGTKVWYVTEHFWRRPGAEKYQPEYEFMVYEGEVLDYREGGWTDVHIRYRAEEGYIKLIDIMLTAKEQKIFDNPRDAALRAKRLTEEHLKHWGWQWKMYPDMPHMPRRWEKYLVEATEYAYDPTDN